MEAVVGLLLMMCGVSHGVETYCDGRQDGAQCYGALGGTVNIQLIDSTSEIPRYQLSKNSLKILDVKKNNVITKFKEQRCLISPGNGTFRLSNLKRNDSGSYTLQTFNSDGRTSGEWTLQLFIQAPVSSVLLVSECLSQGERRVSCSSEGGDSPQYSWTLDGRTLTDAELSVNNETNNITVKQHVSGRLVCSVRNNVSNVSKEQRISTCGAGLLPLLFLPVIGGVISAVVIFLFVGVAVICAQRRKPNNKSTKHKVVQNDYEEMMSLSCSSRGSKWRKEGR
ncbi:ubiquitin carboxyl-terminal hydrolase 18/41 [Sarotherodon galilaeus]